MKKSKLVIAQSRAADSGIYKLTIVNPITGTSTSRDVNVTVVPDITVPSVVSAGSMGDSSAYGQQTVDIQFDKVIDLGGADPSVDPGTARNIANYTFVSPSGAAVTQAEVRKSGKAVRLTVTGLLPSTTFTLKVAGVRNYTRAANTAIPPAGQSASGTVQTLITTTMDVGTAVIGTTYTMGAGEYEAEAGGVDIWGASDSFHYAYKEVSGNFDVSAQIVQVSNPGNRSGIMLRETSGYPYTDVGSRFNYITWIPGNIGFHARDVVDTTPVWANPQQNWFGFGPTPNVWLRLQRVGTLTSAYYATDGMSWVPFGTTTNIIADPALLGLATAANAGVNTGFTKYASYGTTVVHGKLSVSSAGGVFTLSWTGPGVLKSAASLSGPFTTESSQANPQVITPTGTQKFFRLE